MNKLTIVYHYYNNPSAIRARVSELQKLPENIRNQLELVLVDDCSSIRPDFHSDDFSGLNYLHATILEDIPWNQGGARNLGALLASGEWLFMIDVDHYVSTQGFLHLLEREKLESDCFYFNRFDGHTELKKAPNIYFISRKYFWMCGGYDEEFSGTYGCEDILLYRIRSQFMNYNLIKKNFIIVDKGQATTGLSRDFSKNQKLLDEKIELLEGKKYSNGKVLNFRWQVDSFSSI